MQKEERRGQVTVFIIIAIIVVAIGLLIIFFYPKISSGITFDAGNPASFLESCLEDDLMSAISTLSLQGGSLSPTGYYMYSGNPVEYLCYTNEDYKTCVVQQPILSSHIENEIKSVVEQKIGQCFIDLKSSYEKKGYKISGDLGKIDVGLLPNQIFINIDGPITISKKDSKTYDSFDIVLNNNLYELAAIAKNIIKWETRTGEAEITTYMTYYRDLKVEKKQQDDGTRIYILTDLNSGDSFTFASRSQVWPAGYSKP